MTRHPARNLANQIRASAAGLPRKDRLAAGRRANEIDRLANRAECAAEHFEACESSLVAWFSDADKAAREARAAAAKIAADTAWAAANAVLNG